MLEVSLSHFLEIVTWLVILGGLTLFSVVTIGALRKGRDKPVIEVTDHTKKLLEEQFEFLQETGDISEKTSFKYKAKKGKGKLFVLNFNGNVMADEVEILRDEITAVLGIIEPNSDEVLVNITSGGGTVCGYGLVGSQLSRFKKANVKVTASVDQIAASGGYLAACVADRIIAAPFAYIGSIGVVTEMPNFSGLMSKMGVTYSEFTAGDSKRVISQFRENTEEQKAEYTKELEEIHSAFISHVKSNRKNSLLKDDAFTGKSWMANTALNKGLVDEILTSDEFIEYHHKDLEKGGVFKVSTQLPKDSKMFLERLVKVIGNTILEHTSGKTNKI